MKIKLVILTAAVMLTAGVGLAQTTTTTTTTTEYHAWNNPGGWITHMWSPSSLDRYTGCEWSMDFFGSFIANQRKIEDMFKTNIRNGKWGGGVGLHYFPDQYIGIGGDINIPADG